MLASALAFGILAGLALGGRISRLRTFHLAWLPVLAIAVAIRLLAPAAGGLTATVYVIGFLGVAAVAVRNAAMPGMPLVAAGAFLNLVVVAMNGGMPVSDDAVRVAAAAVPTDALHRTATADTKLIFLSDVIPIGILRAVYSVGDAFIALGGAVLAFRSVRP